eukprot:SAG31_NODE_15842_length_735_cov_3.919664_1_plen_85_part_00
MINVEFGQTIASDAKALKAKMWTQTTRHDSHSNVDVPTSQEIERRKLGLFDQPLAIVDKFDRLHLPMKGNMKYEKHLTMHAAYT